MVPRHTSIVLLSCGFVLKNPVRRQGSEPGVLASFLYLVDE